MDSIYTVHLLDVFSINVHLGKYHIQCIPLYSEKETYRRKSMLAVLSHTVNSVCLKNLTLARKAQHWKDCPWRFFSTPTSYAHINTVYMITSMPINTPMTEYYESKLVLFEGIYTIVFAANNKAAAENFVYHPVTHMHISDKY